MALLRPLTIISGGPGTGKTSTVVNLLACLLAHHPHCRIALAAPTGKAAARLIEAMRQRAQHLPQQIQERLPTEAYTLHRLLGVTSAGGAGDGFRHHAGNPLQIDALVVDEASMLDLALATRLFEAVPTAARIILLGDKDQLAAVESGAVFAELSADPGLSPGCVARLAALCDLPAEQIRPAPAVASALSDSVVWLTENFRFAGTSAIGRLASGIRSGDAAGVLDALRRNAESESDSDSNADASLAWIADDAALPGVEVQQHLLAGYAAYLQALRAPSADCASVSAAYARFRILCALRQGPRGAEGINLLLAKALRRALAHPLDPGGTSPWYPGRPVMVLRNDYVLKLFNGDTGIVLPDAQGQLMVYFPDDALGFRAVPPLRLPEHETAFAMTIHKSQGSEFDAVLVLLGERANRLQTRELLYTAVTRARTQVTLVASAAVLQSAIAQATQRHSGLLARLREA